MTDTPSRLFALACVLVCVWVITYWLYDPSHGPKVTLDPRDAAAVSAAKPRPSPPPLDSQPKPVEPSPQPPAAPDRPHKVQKVLAPEFREYIVQKGDVSFERIAARKDVFGDARLAQAISRSNPLVSPDKLKPGITVLKIPVDPENIQGKVVWVDESLPAGVPAPTPTPAPPSAPAIADKTYVTQPSDTLSDISKKFYGKSSLWRTIYQANRDVIPNPDRLASGLTIRIPPEPPQPADSGQGR